VKKFIKALGWLIALGGLVALIAHRGYQRYLEKKAAVEARKKETAAEVPKVRVTTVRTGTVRRLARLTGTVHPMAEVRLMAKVSGRLERLRLPDGTAIERGTVIPRPGICVAVIDHEAFAAQLRQAEAALDALKAQQAEIEAGARPQELEIARANVRGAEAAVKAAEAAVAQAKAALDNATKEYERMRNLYRDKVVTKQQLDAAEAQFEIAREKHRAALEQARSAREQLLAAQQKLRLTEEGARKEERQAIAARVRQAEAALELARINFDECTVETPIAGVVAEKHLDEGNMVGPTTPIITIVQIETAKVVVGVNERDVRFVVPGKTRALVRLDAYPGETFEGAVARVSPVADERTRTVEVEIHIPNPERKLKPGMFARVELLLEERRGVPVVPADAVLRLEEGDFAYVVNDNVAHRRAVRLGLRGGEMVEVVEGLEPGEMVITHGLRLVADGGKVEVVERERATEASER